MIDEPTKTKKKKKILSSVVTKLTMHGHGHNNLERMNYSSVSDNLHNILTIQTNQTRHAHDPKKRVQELKFLGFTVVGP